MNNLVIGIMPGFASSRVEGSHPAAWLHPESDHSGHVSFKHQVRLVQQCERGLFDFFFLADAPGVRPGNLANLRRMAEMADYEPLTLLSALAAVTSNIGLAATASTSYFEPYNVARIFASLDHISNGRAGWNVVTSTIPSLGLNFGKEVQEEHSVRYRRAEEFIEVVLGLWDSWEEGAFVRDVKRAEYFDPNKMHKLNHRGAFYSVAGPLNVPRTPQGHPVIIQAGGSEAGRELAAKTAEIVFAIGNSFESAKAFRDDLHARMRRLGRPTGELKTLLHISLMLGRTEEEAKKRFASIQALLHPDVGREIISFNIGNADLSKVPIDQLIPESLLPTDTNRTKTYLKVVRELAARAGTLKEMYEEYAPGWGGIVKVGTPLQIADQMTDWFTRGAADGFIISPMLLPGDLDLFIAEVIPELQRRGIFRTRYEGRTLRENLGLKTPTSRYAATSSLPADTR